MPSLVNVLRFSQEPQAYSSQRRANYCYRTIWQKSAWPPKGVPPHPLRPLFYLRIADMSTARKSSQEKKPCESIAKSKPTRGSAKVCHLLDIILDSC